MRIEKGQVYKLTSNLNLNEVLYVDGELNLDPTTNATLTTTQNIIVTGKLTGDLRNNPDIVKQIYFKDVDMNKFVGGGTDPIASDVGLWFMGAGTADLKGAVKTEYTTAKGSIPAGAKSIPVNESVGWRKGDKITIWSGDVKPSLGSRSYERSAKRYLDSYVECIERRTIADVVNGQVLFDEPLKFKHEVFVTEKNSLSGGRLFYPYVVNETRNIKINGAEGKRSHIFACAHSKNPDGSTAHNHMKHTFSHVEIFQMGVRKSQAGGAGYVKGIDDIVTGRYAMHFHHAGDGTAGTLIEGCSFHDNGGRCAVPHMANGITFRKNTITFNLGDAMWWDFQEMSHNITYEKNMLVGILWDGVQLGGTAILLGIGDNNKCNDNILMYAHQGDVDGAGAIQWTTDNEGVWEAKRNIIFCSHNADWTWQNSGRTHAIEDQVAVNCNFALTHGAYGNQYKYMRCEAYNSATKVRASGAVFIHCVFDGMNKIPEAVYVQTSAVPGPNKFQECEFKNTPVGVTFDVYPHNEENATPRTVELVNNKYINVNRKYQFVRSNGGNYAGIVPNCAIYTQEGDQAKKIIPMTTEAIIGKFAPDKYGNGDGLLTQIYKGANFETLVQTHIRSAVREDDWRIDLPKMPNGANYKFILPDKVSQSPFSFRYTGFIEPYYTGSHKFRLNGGSGFRLWINNVLRIDSPGNKHDNGEYVDSPAISLSAGVKYPVKIEVYEPGDRNMGIGFAWQVPGKTNFEDVPTSQLYSASAPTVFKNKRLAKDFVRNNCGEGFKGGVFTSVAEEGEVTSTISQADADAKAAQLIEQHGQAEANQFGECIPNIPAPFKNVRMEKEFTRNNCPPGSVGGKYLFVVAAGLFVSSISQADADKKAADYIETLGQMEANELATCTSTVPLKANAGADITTRATEVELDGSASTGDIATWNWYGPATINFTAQNSPKTKVNRLVPGVHNIRLKVTGKDGKTSEDTLTLTVESNLFYNTEVTGTFTRTNCPAGHTPGTVTHTIPAGAYSSPISASTAQALALQALQTEGQAKANSEGTCTPPVVENIVDRVVVYFKNGTSQELK